MGDVGEGDLILGLCVELGEEVGFRNVVVEM